MIRFFFVAIFSLVFLSSPVNATSSIPSYKAPVTIALLGDGLYSGYGLFQPEKSYVKQLEKTLFDESSQKVTVIDFTNEGLNTAITPQYLPAVLKSKPDIVMLGLGYSDALAKIDIDTMHNNMDTILTELYRNRMYVVLLQPTLPQDVEHQYISRYNNMFSRLIKRYDNVVHASEFMNDVVTNPYAFDDSTRYPSELGVDIMLENTKTIILESTKKLRRLRTKMRNGTI